MAVYRQDSDLRCLHRAYATRVRGSNSREVRVARASAAGLAVDRCRAVSNGRGARSEVQTGLARTRGAGVRSWRMPSTTLLANVSSRVLREFGGCAVGCHFTTRRERVHAGRESRTTVWRSQDEGAVLKRVSPDVPVLLYEIGAERRKPGSGRRSGVTNRLRGKFHFTEMLSGLRVSICSNRDDPKNGDSGCLRKSGR